MTTTQTTANVEQWRLPRQAAAPEGPVDVKMMYVMHHAFRRDLVMFAEAAAVTPADDREVWRALSRRWQISARSCTTTTPVRTPGCGRG